MSIISDAVLSSTEWNGIGIFSFDRIPFRVKMILKTTTKRQISKFRKQRIVPLPVLEALFFLGFMPGKEAPKQGMKIFLLAEYLQHGFYQNEQNAANGYWLYEKIVREEMIGRGPVVKKEKIPAFSVRYNCRAKTIKSTNKI